METWSSPRKCSAACHPAADSRDGFRRHETMSPAERVPAIRGENVHPSGIDAALNQIAEHGGEHRLVISREAATDERLLRVGRVAEWDGGRGPQSASRDVVGRQCQALLGPRVAVTRGAPNRIARTDFGDRRLIDDRVVFRDRHAQLVTVAR